MEIRSLNQSVTGGSRYVLDFVPRTGDQTGLMVDRTDILNRRVTILHDETRELHADALLADLQTRQAKHGKRSPSELLEGLSEIGLAWRDIARIIGVTVPAIQKWRRGEGVTGINRSKIAKLVALIEMLEIRMINEPASWLEMRCREEVALTPLDMLADGHFELVLTLASQEEELDLEGLLTKYYPMWRDKFVDDVFEVFEANDGAMSIRMRA